MDQTPKHQSGNKTTKNSEREDFDMEEVELDSNSVATGISGLTSLGAVNSRKNGVKWKDGTKDIEKTKETVEKEREKNIKAILQRFKVNAEEIKIWVEANADMEKKITELVLLI